LFGFHYLEKRGANKLPAHLWLGLSILVKVMLSSGWLLVEFATILNFRLTHGWVWLLAVLRIQIRMFLVLLDPDPYLLVRGMDPDTDSDHSIIKLKY
jgi:hypothetical protein